MEARTAVADPTASTTAGLLERALGEDPAAAPAHPELLDAARDLFCRHGIQRTTMDDVARHAGLSRITVYRRTSSKEALVEAVVLREFRRYLDQFLVDIAEARTVEERVVVGFVSSMRTIRGNELIAALLAAEPQLLVPSVVGRGGHTLAVVGRFVAGQLRREQRAGHVDRGVDVDLVGELMVRMSSSLLLTPSALVDVDDDLALGDLARRYLVPMLRIPPDA